MGSKKTVYQNEWINRARDRINLNVPKGEKEQYTAHAAARGESLNGFIRRAVLETMQRENGEENAGKL